MEKLTCRFCGEQFDKGWSKKLGRSGMDQLVMHVRDRHSTDWYHVKIYSVGTTRHKEKQFAEIAGAYSVEDESFYKKK